MATFPQAQSLRVLCIDGGGIKGYTALLILRRIFRQLIDAGELAEAPLPCDVFDLIAGTSTGGLIAIMLGRLHMSIDECIAKYEIVGKSVFKGRPNNVTKILKGVVNSPFYDIKTLQDEVKTILKAKEMDLSESFLEKESPPRCKVYAWVRCYLSAFANMIQNDLRDTEIHLQA